MTQEYEEAVEIVARQLCGADDDQWRYLTERRHVLEPWIAAARAVLSLTWPSGQPVIGVLSKDQTSMPWRIYQCKKVLVSDVQDDMKAAGFRRVVKQEAK